jgi:hypothetical protein
MLGLPLAFATPMILTSLILLPVIWWLLRLTPPRPQTELFPPLAILARLVRKEETPAKSPWWLTLLRLLMAALVIFAMAGPVLNPLEARLTGEGPVAIVMDNGWAAAPDWESRREAALALVAEAEAASRTVLFIDTAGMDAAAMEPMDAIAARARLTSMEPRPLKPDHATAAGALSRVIGEARPGSLFFLSDGLSRAGTDALAQAMATAPGQRSVIAPRTQGTVALDVVRNDPDAMSGTVLRTPGNDPLAVTVEAYDLKGLPLARRSVTFEPGADSAQFKLDEPVELRNQIVRLAVNEMKSAGGVQLLDDRYRRRLVGIVSGEAADTAQPLLAPLYYIRKALSPFGDVREASTANVTTAVPELIGQGVSAMVLADVGNLSDETEKTLGDWVKKGGMLIRFAGARLAAAGNSALLPVRLREGDRNLGGALSWDTPKLVAPFEEGSPFFGLEPPNEVTVQRQVLALQDFDLEQKTWAALEDGTPLVTADKLDAGWIVLFHVSSDATWSNLPISGTFVEMLRRVVNQSSSTGIRTAGSEDVRLPPLNVLNGRGELTPPDVGVKPVVLRQNEAPMVTVDNPPGFYGTEDGFVSLNLFDGKEKLTALDTRIFGQGVQLASYARDAAIDLKPWLIAIAALLLFLDCLAVLWIAGTLRPGNFGRKAARAAGMIAAVAMVLSAPPETRAQEEAATDFAAALTTRLAYVVTGDSDVDETSRAGLAGLTQFVANRTALEPGEPVGLDIATDELAFYPIIYWPISMNAPLPDNAAMARVDSFMKQGGTILFDTRDQGGGLLGGTANSPEAQRLQLMLSNLDIPPLEPVPGDHVLTKAFYLLTEFPGRYSGGELWVEQLLRRDEEEGDRPARAGDGVSTIIITANDLAAAWAVDAGGQPMFPTDSADPMQREMAFRSGVNIVMYSMTGNYKADQVHIPALLERLGQ